ncbi:hypothetical protein [Chryseobacterium sp. SIMBA_028]|uniref:hypothetical protein n=1 Tax=Chryseobacterium sp. SIMBA_028 TaxID=3085771 RepID=UPI003978AC08
MKALEQLTADIREKLPRLMDLTQGSIIKSLIEDKRNYLVKDSFLEIGYNEDYTCLVDNQHVNIRQVHLDGYTYKLESFEIIGKEPILNDVLEWHSKHHSKNSHFEVFNIVMNDVKHPAGVFLDYSEEDTARFIWDLSKPYLKDQTPELITFLHGLIKKEKIRKR